MKKNDFLNELKVGDFVTIYEDGGYRLFSKVTNITKKFIFTSHYGHKFYKESGICYGYPYYKLVKQTKLDREKSINKYRLSDIRDIMSEFNVSDNKKLHRIIELVKSWEQ